MASERISGRQVGKLRLIKVKDFGQLLHILRRGLGLSIEYGGYSYFIPADGFPDVGEGQVLVDFGVEEGLRLDGKARGQ